MTSSSSSTSGPHWRGLFGPLLAGLLIILACGSGPTRTTREIDLAPFKDLAKSSDCSETRNRLFLIDRALVLWDREGTVANLEAPDLGLGPRHTVQAIDF